MASDRMNEIRKRYSSLANRAYKNGEKPVLLPSGDLEIPSCAKEAFVDPTKWTRNYLTHGDVSKLVSFFDPTDEQTLEHARRFMHEHGIFLRTVQFTDLNESVQETYKRSIDDIVRS